MYIIQKWCPESQVWVCMPIKDGLVYEYLTRTHAHMAARYMDLHVETDMGTAEFPIDRSLSVWWRVAQVQL